VLKNTKPKLRDFLDMLKDHEKKLEQFLWNEHFLDHIKQECSVQLNEQDLDMVTYESKLQLFVDGIDRKRTCDLKRITTKKPEIYT
jgi:hypothetical protein